MSDVVRLAGVRAYGAHGVLEEEKTRPQPFVVDVELEMDLAPAGGSDDLSDSVSYADVAVDVVAVIEGEHADLVETLAARIADRVLARDLVEAVTVTVHKPEAPIGLPFGDVGVTIRRERRRRVVIALGANLGDPARTLARAAISLARLDGLTIDAVSRLVDTDPVGGPDQPAYLNAVAVGTTRLHPRTLLRHLHRIEAEHGRVREVRWGARTLDLDLVLVGDPRADDDVRSDDPALTLPHPRAAERAFVLVPWADADPSAVLRVGDGVMPVAGLLERVGVEGVRPGPPWPHPGPGHDATPHDASAGPYAGASAGPRGGGGRC